MAWIIKVLTPEHEIKHVYVTSIRKNKKAFSAISHSSGAKRYKRKSNFSGLLSFLDECDVHYEVIEISDGGVTAEPDRPY